VLHPSPHMDFLAMKRLRYKLEVELNKINID
jgi:hypothetical protein